MVATYILRRRRLTGWHFGFCMSDTTCKTTTTLYIPSPLCLDFYSVSTLSTVTFTVLKLFCAHSVFLTPRDWGTDVKAVTGQDASTLEPACVGSWMMIWEVVKVQTQSNGGEHCSVYSDWVQLCQHVSLITSEHEHSQWATSNSQLEFSLMKWRLSKTF